MPFAATLGEKWQQAQFTKHRFYEERGTVLRRHAPLVRKNICFNSDSLVLSHAREPERQDVPLYPG